MEKNKKQQADSNVEFGNEFGDINASKVYEIAFQNNKGKKAKKRK